MNMPKQSQKIDKMAGLPPGEPVKGKTYRADDYSYRDLPRMSKENFDQFREIAGDENLVWLSLASYGSEKRGQVLISPDGMRRLQDYAVTPGTQGSDGAGNIGGDHE